MNETLQHLLRHSSVRHFTNEPVSAQDRELILNAARQASTSCNLQVTSIIRVTDPDLRAKLAVCAGNQAHVIEAPEFWVFVADYHRNQILCPEADLGWAEQGLVGTTDTAIMAQNAMVALESLGYGGCFIGGIRNGVKEASELLGLPKGVYLVMGLAFGRPASKPGLKPRLPASVTFMENRYQDPDSHELTAYDETMRDYYTKRESHAKDITFRESLKAYLLKERRPFIMDYLHQQGFFEK